MKMSIPGAKLLFALAEHGMQPLCGNDLRKLTNVKTGTLYPILYRFEEAGWVSADWEKIDPHAAKRPRKRFYRITAAGQKEAEALRNDFLPIVRGFA